MEVDAKKRHKKNVRPTHLFPVLGRLFTLLPATRPPGINPGSNQVAALSSSPQTM